MRYMYTHVSNNYIDTDRTCINTSDSNVFGLQERGMIIDWSNCIVCACLLVDVQFF